MRIYTLWAEGDEGEMPWQVDSVDEYTVDNNGDFPETYKEKKNCGTYRELILCIPDEVVQRLFIPPEVAAKVIREDGQ